MDTQPSSQEKCSSQIAIKDDESHLPEYEVFESLKAQRFTLAVESVRGNRYLEMGTPLSETPWHYILVHSGYLVW
jgi:hypothetical protein